MPKIARSLTDVAIKNIKRPGYHAVGGPVPASSSR